MVNALSLLGIIFCKESHFLGKLPKKALLMVIAPDYLSALS